jgi:hypothetical protein
MTAISLWACALAAGVMHAAAFAVPPASNEALVEALVQAEGESDAEGELKARLALAEHALSTGNARGAIQEYHAIAAFYRRGGDKASAAAADFEAARTLVTLGLWDDAFATLAQSEGDEIDSARLAQRLDIRVVVLERNGDVPAARAALRAVNRIVTREDWNRHLGDHARRLDVAYGWPTLDRRTLRPILILEWGALAALVVFAYRRGARREPEGPVPRRGDADGRV